MNAAFTELLLSSLNFSLITFCGVRLYVLFYLVSMCVVCVLWWTTKIQLMNVEFAIFFFFCLLTAQSADTLPQAITICTMNMSFLAAHK